MGDEEMTDSVPRAFKEILKIEEQTFFVYQK